MVRQGLLRLLEENVILYSRTKDVSIVEAASEGAREQYKEISGRTVTISVEAELPEDRYIQPKTPSTHLELIFDFSAGGVVLIGSNKRIVINNTLEERLQLLEDKVCFITN